LISTITPLNCAEARMPTTSKTVSASVRMVAGRLMSAPVQCMSDGPAPASGALASEAGKSIPKLLSRLTK
jgi:hypothetical protein